MGFSGNEHFLRAPACNGELVVSWGEPNTCALTQQLTKNDLAPFQCVCSIVLLQVLNRCAPWERLPLK